MITRYDFDIEFERSFKTGDDIPFISANVSDSGDCVYYEDHLRVVEELTEKIKKYEYMLGFRTDE